ESGLPVRQYFLPQVCLGMLGTVEVTGMLGFFEPVYGLNPLERDELGNECEYRHSESARVNPRDCWFWLSGNCLNPSCSFRHP
ncbi:hypothetical protein KI387_032035, partial [Taxus chinensis]